MDNHLDNVPVSNQEDTPGSAPYEEPQGELEQAIARSWKAVFHLNRIGRNDNFFELGGNSLLGMDLSEMLTARFAVEVPVLTIFLHPTVAELAEIISSR